MYHGRKGVKLKRRRGRPALFGVVCKNVTEEMYELILKPCIQSIVRHHPDGKIVIVDSDSDWQYFNKVKEIKSDIIIEDIKNKNYEAGAWFYILEKYPDEDTYVLLQDSAWLTGSLTKVYPEEDGVCIFGPHWKSIAPRGPIPARLAKNMLEEMGRGHLGYGGKKRRYNMVACNMFMLGKEAAKMILKLDEWKRVLPTEWATAKELGKWNCQAWERIWGVVFDEARTLYGLKVSYLNQIRPHRRGGMSNYLKKKCWRSIEGTDMKDGQGRE